MGKAQRVKGHSFERQTAIDFRVVFPDSMRNVTEAQTGGQGIDLVNTGKLDIQCKRYKNYAPITKIFEVPQTPGRIAVLITKGDRQEPMVVLRQSDFLRIIQDIGVVYDD